MLVEITFRAGADPALLHSLREAGWSVLLASSRAAIVAENLEAARRSFLEATDLDPELVVWRSPSRSGAVPLPPSPPPLAPPKVRRRLPRTP